MTKTSQPPTPEQLGRYLALILRHEPERGGVALDKQGGWTNVSALIETVSARWRPITFALLRETVVMDEKGRYSFDFDISRIRANWGHSDKLGIDLQLVPSVPPEILYHGTAVEAIPAIVNSGALLPMKRSYVCLHERRDEALSVGLRHSKSHASTVLIVSARACNADAGVRFFAMGRGLWLADAIPADYVAIRMDALP